MSISEPVLLPPRWMRVVDARGGMTNLHTGRNRFFVRLGLEDVAQPQKEPVEVRLYRGAAHDDGTKRYLIESRYLQHLQGLGMTGAFLSSNHRTACCTLSEQDPLSGQDFDMPGNAGAKVFLLLRAEQRNQPSSQLCSGCGLGSASREDLLCRLCFTAFVGWSGQRFEQLTQVVEHACYALEPAVDEWLEAGAPGRVLKREPHYVSSNPEPMYIPPRSR